MNKEIINKMKEEISHDKTYARQLLDMTCFSVELTYFIHNLTNACLKN